jgi:hypothetical protein
MKKALALLIATVSLFLATASTASAAPTITLEETCGTGGVAFGVTILLSGFPPNTPFTETITSSAFGSPPPLHETFNANGSFFPTLYASDSPNGLVTVTVEYTGGTVTNSIDGPCEGPRHPTTKQQCKAGGYKEFGFKNQGRCIAFVNHQRKT